MRPHCRGNADTSWPLLLRPLLVPENDDVREDPNTMTTTTTTTTPVATLDAERTDFLAQLAASRSALIAATRGLTDEQAGE
jgi:hypothetical protein